MKLFLTIKKRTIIIVSLIVVFTIVLSVCTCGKSTTAFNKKRKLPIYSVQTDKKEIAISFDCAWGVDYTDELLSIMNKEGVKCTFFMVKFWVDKYPEYVKKIDDNNHEIGSHSTTHPYMSKLSKVDIERELTCSIDAIKSITHKEVKVFRPPYGDYNDLLIETCEELKVYPIQWDVDSLDWKNLSKEEICSRVLKRVKAGSIVLFHNNGLHTAEALPIIIKELKNKGYVFKTIGELIYKENYYIDSNGKQICNV